MYNKIKTYGFFGGLHIFISFLYTKIFFPKARLIRLPFDIRNRKNIEFASRFTTGVGCRLESFPLSDDSRICIKIGENVQINDYVHIGAVGSIRIGDNVLIASKVYISDHNHGSYDDVMSDHPMSLAIERKPICKPVLIGDNVWIGESVCVLPGVTIGKGFIIGALSVVSKDIPAYSIAVGNPAIIVKKYDFKINKWKKCNNGNN